MIGREDGLVWHWLAQAVWSRATPCELVLAREWIEPRACFEMVRWRCEAVDCQRFDTRDGLGGPSYIDFKTRSKYEMSIGPSGRECHGKHLRIIR